MEALREYNATINFNHSLSVAENLLQQDLTAQRRVQVWVGDTTYIDTAEDWLYLAVILDLHSRKIVGGRCPIERQRRLSAMRGDRKLDPQVEGRSHPRRALHRARACQGPRVRLHRHVCYNRTRLRPLLGYLSPDEFELSPFAWKSVCRTRARSPERCFPVFVLIVVSLRIG